MLVAKVIDGQILQVADCRELCEWYPPTDEQLKDRNLVKCNVWLPHNHLTQELVNDGPYLQDGWVNLVKVKDREIPLEEPVIQQPVTIDQPIIGSDTAVGISLSSVEQIQVG